MRVETVEMQSVAALVTVPAGRYWLGDPCYVVPDSDWGDLLDACDYFRKPVGVIRGFDVLAFRTRYGDGGYTDQYGQDYFVDAGLIGLTPAEYCDTEGYGERLNGEMGRWVDFVTPATCRCLYGDMWFGDIHIDTDDSHLED